MTTGEATICNVAATLLQLDRESQTRAVKLNVPLGLGVPDTTPMLDRFNPAGRLPEFTFQVYGLVPPVAANANE